MFRGFHSRGYLPHIDDGSKIQHVTVHLADSLPKAVIEGIDHELKGMPESRRIAERRKRLHAWLDSGHGTCILREPSIAAMVQGAFLHFHGMRYELHAWVVMPNHFHVLFQPKASWELGKIVASWKKYTARGIQDAVRKSREPCTDTEEKTIMSHAPAGEERTIAAPKPVWFREYWDRFIRDEGHHARVLHYIHDNPVAAGLVARAEDWPWSSAHKADDR